MSLVIERLAGQPVACRVVLQDIAATARLAGWLSTWFGPRDTITLTGDLGAGKTEFARALIRAFAEDAGVDVPSPTFPILISYDFPRGRVVHADLYRILETDELDELGWDELRENALLLVEWPDRADDRLPADRLDVELFHAAGTDFGAGLGPEARVAILTGHGSFGARLDRFQIADGLIEQSGFAAAERVFLQGDASSRSYTRLVAPGRSAILMNAPRQPDGPPLRRGLPYSQLVHLAEDVKPFVAMDRALLAQGLSAPLLYSADLDAGLLVLEDLGREGVVAGTPAAPVPERYHAAMEVLGALHTRNLPRTLNVAPRVERALPTYDVAAMLTEIDLMLDWYLPARGIRLDGVVREEFHLLWRSALNPVLAEPPTWVLRDYHSPNLIWLPGREGLRKVGLIDFQDAVMGPAAYDVVSLAQDARVDVPEELELQLVSHYVKLRREADPTFDVRGFARSYALMGAQRASKILGIFTRLNDRDGKPHYLRHLSRIRRHLARCLSHQDLGSLRMWYEAVLPSKDFAA
ncbi:tRNA (adenosine(37)-N6)-threonylcarbamoyltransferase complex ATPase subunit type 1 TsaE [Xanthobacter autotrophicus]|uniref:tRNA (adenosine(37)-N6)-threonylcarbamoyltransferase complex ATPase subunit type 1 TsaE n=1 Tax=Xanthobacter autotrophicus TaxID=280 RepID=UPI0024A75E55|nr:tRNA (adenosine(37)-N6)-threonylcarbamoyltransferase complex ATPase subunit type 1 TsaE [Xanthobacter autotrophicus]MDI4658515.1 tRNA (adenosine(37)-N6)-threonylcarbamoyltransferase complex ATPase subunit type 1 TsaE [Xanthobacter autotrophicus]